MDGGNGRNQDKVDFTRPRISLPNADDITNHASMTTTTPNLLPPLVSPGRLESHLSDGDLLIVCTGNREQYLRSHIPGAVHLDVSTLNFGEPPVKGLLPPIDQLETTFSRLGLTDQTHVVAYDDEATTSAARLFWVLEAVGHKRVSFLDGGLAGWQALELPLESGEVTGKPVSWRGTLDDTVITGHEAILTHIENGDVEHGRVRILDSRAPEEYQGLKSASERKGRIPGAVNLNWLDTIGDDRMLKSPASLEAALAALGIDPGSDVIVHCQTHQRSSHSFMMLRSLGYSRVRGYPGSWSEWSLNPELPIVGRRESDPWTRQK